MSSPFLSYVINNSCNYRANLGFTEKIVCYVGITDLSQLQRDLRFEYMLMNRTHSPKL
ncbi:MAG: hypothetical protein DHS20C13_00950 [Thermodesulfobacteriota bacterium]|nr:MAG: hypothetical protein DHS20C13_00950 [Thermodesulfobacteriota bacterium]